LLTKRISVAATLAIAVAIVIAVSVGRKPAPPQEPAPDEFRPLADIEAVSPAPLPAVAFKTLDGAPVALAAYKGRPVLLNFWATWCGPCVKEMPALDRLAATQGPGGIAVLAVSADRTGAAAVRPFMAAHDIGHVTVLLDQDSDAVHALGLAGFPTTLIVDGAGHERGKLEGPARWDEAAARIRALTQ
jgi:thiol-disulfide isomerase/thioredoxin